MTRPRSLPAALVLAPLLGLGAPRAAEVQVHVRDGKGKAVADAVLVLVPAGRPPSAGEGSPRIVIDQVEKEFVPYVSAIRVGTLVTFPNRDNIRHHVYSFSPAKKFELPLYKGMPAQPVRFDQPGVVVLGCNIHDWMVAYVYVLESPHFAVTGPDGNAAVTALPAGEYRVEAHHPRAKTEAAPTTLLLGAGDSRRIEIEVGLRPDLRPPRAGKSGARAYP